jgi:ubiquitin C-terminal hydrolase
MKDMLTSAISEEMQNDIKEFVSIVLLLSKEDRAILLSNANALKVRRDLEKAREENI